MGQNTQRPRLDALLVFAPYQSNCVNSFYSAPYWLADHLSRNACAARVLDLNREIIDILLRADQLEAERRALAAELAALDAVDAPDAAQKRRYLGALTDYTRLQLCLDNIEFLRLPENVKHLAIPDGPQYTQLLGGLPERICLDALDDDCMRSMHSSDALRELVARPESQRFAKLLVPRLEEVITRENPRAVGFCVAFSFQMLPTLVLAREVRRFDASIHITMGGPVPSLLRAGEMQALIGTKTIDSVVRYAGEDPLLELVRQLRSSPKLSPIANVVVEDDSEGDAEGAGVSNNGSVCGSLGVATRSGQDDVAPRYRIDDEALAQLSRAATIPVMQSRGCYWGRCTFCDYINLYGENRYAPRPIAQIIEDLEFYVSKGFHHFMLVTDSLPPKPAREISKGIIARGLDVTWSSFLKVDRRWTLETLSLMRQAGYDAARIGLESSHSRLLQILDKGYDEDEAHRFMHKLELVGFPRVSVNIITNPPTATLQESLEVVEFARAHRQRLTRCSTYPFILTQTSHIGQDPEKYGLHMAEAHREDSRSSCRAASLAYEDPEGMSSEELEHLEAVWTDLNSELFAEWGYGGLLARLLGAKRAADLSGFRFGFPRDGEFISALIPEKMRMQPQVDGLLGLLGHSGMHVVDSSICSVCEDLAGQELSLEAFADYLEDAFETQDAGELSAIGITLLQHLARRSALAYIRTPNGEIARASSTSAEKQEGDHVPAARGRRHISEARQTPDRSDSDANVS